MEGALGEHAKVWYGYWGPITASRNAFRWLTGLSSAQVGVICVTPLQRSPDRMHDKMHDTMLDRKFRYEIIVRSQLALRVDWELTGAPQPSPLEKWR